MSLICSRRRLLIRHDLIGVQCDWQETWSSVCRLHRLSHCDYTLFLHILILHHTFTDHFSECISHSRSVLCLPYCYRTTLIPCSLLGHARKVRALLEGATCRLWCGIYCRNYTLVLGAIVLMINDVSDSARGSAVNDSSRDRVPAHVGWWLWVWAGHTSLMSL